MPYPQQGVQPGDICGVGGTHFIWGATAGMLRNFYRFLLA